MSHSHSDPSSCCSTASAELKIYQAFIFSIPIFFTFILLFLFYIFYLRRRRLDSSSLRMRASYESNHRLSGLGLKKELREMLPIIIFKESFSIRDAQCSVCLGDYQGEDRLQQIPACGHTFHMDCIDNWLANHTTCPLCRLSLLPAAKIESGRPGSQLEEAQVNETQSNEESTENGNERERGGERMREAEERGNYCVSNEEELWNERREDEQGCGQGSVIVIVEAHGGVEQETMRNHP